MEFDYLKRKVSRSKQYDYLIEKSSCNATYLGKGDTFKTLELMSDWTRTYQNQTSKLAKKLNANSLKQTTANIQKFIYNYLQYKADGFKQTIKRPACAYSSRFEGLDCKSYSLFAGSLLLNNDIGFYYRKIQQGSDSKGEYSHVYVVIPNDQTNYNLKQGYEIIDGTLQTQIETPYISKYDKLMKPMPHYGLNAANNIAHPCPPIIRSRFLTMLAVLQSKGYNTNDLQNFKQTVQNHVYNGIDPKIKFLNTGVLVQGQLISIRKQNQQGLTGLSGCPTQMETSVSCNKVRENVWRILDPIIKKQATLAESSTIYSKVERFLTYWIAHQQYHADYTSTECRRKYDQYQVDNYTALRQEIREQILLLRTKGVNVEVITKTAKASTIYPEMATMNPKKDINWRNTNPTLTWQEYNLTPININVTDPNITNPNITNPIITNPNITNPIITNPVNTFGASSTIPKELIISFGVLAMLGIGYGLSRK